MSKYIIELGEDANMVQVISVTPSGNAYIDSTVYVVHLEQLNSDYINEHFGRLQDEAYQRGLNDAWEAARKIVCDDELDWNTLLHIFNRGNFDGIFGDFSPSEAIAKLKAYEENQKADDKIEAGDEVIYNGTTKCLVVRPETDERYAVLIDSNGNHHHADHSECKKTGRHFDIGKILEEMRK